MKTKTYKGMMRKACRREDGVKQVDIAQAYDLGGEICEMLAREDAKARAAGVDFRPLHQSMVKNGRRRIARKLRAEKKR